MNSELWLQVSAGQGPAECALAVVKVIDEILRDAASKGIACRLIEAAPGLEPGTANSALLSIEGETLIVDSFAAGWEGTVQWTARSPFRPAHKRKNWFVGIEAIRPLDDSAPSLDSRRDVRWETMRAAGPGGQHVNRTESAVRVTHLSTGISATASEERSQHRNRKLALARLASKLAERSQAARREQQTERWRAHQELERGNPVRVLRG